MKRLLACTLLIAGLTACVGDDVIDDYVQPELRLLALVDTIGVGESFQFTTQYFNNVGAMDGSVAPEWSSSAPEVVEVNPTGLATARRAGSAVITARIVDFGEETVATHVVYGGEETVVVEEPTMRAGSIRTTSSYELEGDFTLTENASGGLTLAFDESYRADSGLPGLVVYLTNNPGSVADALEIQAVKVFAGAHVYEIPSAGLQDYSHVLYYCKPFNVKVGDGEIK